MNMLEGIRDSFKVCLLSTTAFLCKLKSTKLVSQESVHIPVDLSKGP